MRIAMRSWTWNWFMRLPVCNICLERLLMTKSSEKWIWTIHGHYSRLPTFTLEYFWSFLVQISTWIISLSCTSSVYEKICSVQLPLIVEFLWSVIWVHPWLMDHDMDGSSYPAFFLWNYSGPPSEFVVHSRNPSFRPSKNNYTACLANVFLIKLQDPISTCKSRDRRYRRKSLLLRGPFRIKIIQTT